MKNTNGKNENINTPEDRSDVYTEVVEYLKTIDDDEKLEKLPMEFVELLKKKSNPNYKPKISKDIPLEEQNLKEETYSLIAWISKKYWDEVVLQKVYVENDIDRDILTYLEENNNLPTLYENSNVFQKIRIKMRKFINRHFKRNRKETDKQEI